MHIEIDSEVVNDIIRQELLEDIDMIKSDIERLEAKDVLEDYEAEDLRDHRRQIEALRETARYYTWQGEWKSLGL